MYCCIDSNDFNCKKHENKFWSGFCFKYSSVRRVKPYYSIQDSTTVMDKDKTTLFFNNRENNRIVLPHSHDTQFLLDSVIKSNSSSKKLKMPTAACSCMIFFSPSEMRMTFFTKQNKTDYLSNEVIFKRIKKKAGQERHHVSKSADGMRRLSK